MFWVGLFSLFANHLSRKWRFLTFFWFELLFLFWYTCSSDFWVRNIMPWQKITLERKCNSRVSKQSKNKSYFIYCRTFRSQDIIHPLKGKNRLNYITGKAKEKQKSGNKGRNENRRIKFGPKRLYSISRGLRKGKRNQQSKRSKWKECTMK